ncbi:hypothetical protein M9H77_30538 [Catharanthus roseus]|uniref:Uncharacterized protein n=1 Tax=Catharanthus roseus TaxID=4058 RepID=A0ACB9ZXX5_CATRO|nr:hypothetical protein M9H77_30538 [Catharanthus roseus]
MMQAELRIQFKLRHQITIIMILQFSSEGSLTRKAKEPKQLPGNEASFYHTGRRNQSSCSASVLHLQQNTTYQTMPFVIVRHDKRRKIDQSNNITNGTKKVRISLIDEIGREQLQNFI